MNFNLIPDKLVNDFQKADDESAIINVLTNEKSVPDIIVECNPYIEKLDLFITVKDNDIEKLVKFTQQKTDVDISKNRLASVDDYNVVFRIYDEDGEYIEFGVIDMEIGDDGEDYDNESGFDISINVHTFDKDALNVLYLENAEYIELYDKQGRKIKVDTYDDSVLAEYTL